MPTDGIMDTGHQNTISGLLRPARTETFEHTITGLLMKRADLFNEAERIRDRLAEIKNDIGARWCACYARPEKWMLPVQALSAALRRRRAKRPFS
jgi:hypothetical protein